MHRLAQVRNVRFIPKHLALRLIFVLTVMMVAVASFFAYVSMHVQERQLVDGMVLGADQLSRSIASATWHAMLADRRDDVYKMLATIGQEPGIESVRIFNKEGRVTYSTDPHAARQVDKNAEACFLCHARERPLVRVDVPSRARIYKGPDGRRHMGMVTPIYNAPACQASCHAHPATQSVLGVLDISMSLERVDRDLARFKVDSLIVTLSQVLLMALFIVMFTRRFVGVPIRRLIDGTKAISAMDLDQRIEVEAPGELRELEESFNDMRERLRQAVDELNHFAHELEQKVEERSRQLSLAQTKLIKSDRLASLGQLSASVAHEINNPISGVLNLSMLLRRILQEDGIPPGRVEEFRRYLTQISEETSRVGRIVTDLLAFSRRPSPQSSSADLNKLVEKTLMLLAHKLELGNVQVDLQLDPALPPVPCDPSQIQQVVINLVMNAAEAMTGGGRVVVRTRVERHEDTAVFEVTDTGVGIPEKNLSRIFDPFFTTKGEGKGVGLGLSVVYGIVEAHGGSIDVSSQVDRGTTFTVSLPLHPVVAAAHGIAAPETRPDA